MNKRFAPAPSRRGLLKGKADAVARGLDTRAIASTVAHRITLATENP